MDLQTIALAKIAFATIARLAKGLQIFKNRLATFCPWENMINDQLKVVILGSAFATDFTSHPVTIENAKS
jgi:hypothetical protein